MDCKIGDSTADTELLVHGKQVRVHRQVLEAQSYRFRAMLSGHWDPVINEYTDQIIYKYLSFLYDNEVDFTRDELENLYHLALSYHEVPLIQFIERKLQEWNFWQRDVFLTFSEQVRFLFANSVTVTIFNVENLLTLANAGNGRTKDSTMLLEKCDQFLCDNWIENFKNVSRNQRSNALCRLKQIIISKLQSSNKEFLSTYTQWVKDLHCQSLNPGEKFLYFEVLLDYSDLCISYPPCLLDVWNLDSLIEVIKQQFSWFQRRPDSHWSVFFGRFKKCMDYLDKHRRQFGSLWTWFCTNLADRYHFNVILSLDLETFIPVRLDCVINEWKTVLLQWEKLGPDFVKRFATNFCRWVMYLYRIIYLDSRKELYQLCNDPRYVRFFENLARTEYIAQRKRSIKVKILQAHWPMFEIRDFAPVLGLFCFDNLEEHLFDVIKIEGFKFQSFEMRRVVDLLSSGDPRYLNLESEFAKYADLDHWNMTDYVNKFSTRPKMMVAVGKLFSKELDNQIGEEYSEFYTLLDCNSGIEAFKKIDGFDYLDLCPLWALFVIYDHTKEFREEILEKRNFDQYLTRRIQTDGFDFASDHPGMQRIVELLRNNNQRYVGFELKFAQNSRLTIENSAIFALKFKTRPRMLEALQNFKLQQASVDNQEECEGNFVSNHTSTKKQRTN